jgi:hypothetical protein
MVSGKTVMKLKHTLKHTMSLFPKHHGVFFPLECMTRHRLSHTLPCTSLEMHTVVYNDNANIFEIVNNEQNQKTTLTEYFQANIDYPLAREVMYMDFPSVFTWTNETKKWTIR